MAQTSAGMEEPELPQKELEHPEEVEKAAYASPGTYRSTRRFPGQDQLRA